MKKIDNPNSKKHHVETVLVWGNQFFTIQIRGGWVGGSDQFGKKKNQN